MVKLAYIKCQEIYEKLFDPVRSQNFFVKDIRNYMIVYLSRNLITGLIFTLMLSVFQQVNYNSSPFHKFLSYIVRNSWWLILIDFVFSFTNLHPPLWLLDSGHRLNSQTPKCKWFLFLSSRPLFLSSRVTSLWQFFQVNLQLNSWIEAVFRIYVI